MLRERIVDADALERVLHQSHRSALYQLVFDPGDHNPTSAGDIPAWTWLAPVLMECLRRGNAHVAAGVVSLVAARAAVSRREPWAVDIHALNALFSTKAVEDIELLSESSHRIVDPEQRRLVDCIVASGRVALSGCATGNDVT